MLLAWLPNGSIQVRLREPENKCCVESIETVGIFRGTLFQEAGFEARIDVQKQTINLLRQQSVVIRDQADS